MKSLEGHVFYPWPKPEKRMINGVPVEDSDSDDDGKAKKQVLNPAD